MDGLLVNTEDLYSVCTNEVLREYGKPDMPWSVKAQLQGRPFPDVCYINHSISTISTRAVTTTNTPSLPITGQSNLQRMGQAPLHLRRIQH